MNLKHSYFLLFVISLITTSVFSQNIPIGTWRDHLSYSDAVSVTQNGSLTYCASSSALFVYDKSDGSMQKINLVNGLSDIGISKIKHVPANNRIVIGYVNGNIDVILEDKTIYNLSFLKNSGTIGSKTINHIEIVDEFAYLSTGIGIVVLNTNKLEISDTYNYVSSGSSPTNAVAFDNTNIYAASDNGVYFADKTSLNLSDFNAWSNIAALGNVRYNGIVFYNNQILVSYDSPIWQSDTLYKNNGGVWEKFPTTSYPKNITGISVSNGKLLETANKKLYIYDNSLAVIDSIYNTSSIYSLDIAEAILTADNNYWIADKSNGLVKYKSYSDNEKILPNGPSSSSSFKMDIVNNKLWVVSGSYITKQQTNIINYQNDNWWQKLSKTYKNDQGSEVKGIVNVAINPNDNNIVYASSWANGLLEFNNKKLTKVYDVNNSPLENTGSLTVIGPLVYDENNNLWISNSYVTNILSVKTTDGNWYKYSFPGLTTTQDEYHDMLIDQNNYKWIANVLKKKIIVFNDNGTLDFKGDDTFKALTGAVNEIPGTRLYTIEEDLDGEIWLGTDKGIAVFYNPSDVFNTNIKAERIYIQQDGQTQILLENEIINSIAIDGANRKWIGTQTSGAFLMSEDGTEEIEHLTKDNSPLFSNNIIDIEINDETGEVYFGTDKGLISYKGTATEAAKDFDNVFVYPNPVREDYTGTIAIRGLVEDTDVRITDVSGNIVYQTTSLGGQAIWDGNDMYGNRVQTGVYLLFNGSKDGEKKYAAKILFIH